MIPMTQEAAAVLTKATELFLAHLGQSAHANAGGEESSAVVYDNIAAAVEGWEAANDCLKDIVPQKVSGTEALARQAELRAERGEEEEEEEP
ncbi:hypothetical protein FOA52_014385 [Chlamydomonas sp. UWO 241]|nr:hypothetical protein FOA52_014385 [Chlamydomonas sp. UWO 241]